MTSEELYEIVVATRLDKLLIYRNNPQLNSHKDNSTAALRRGALVRVPLGQREVTGMIVSKVQDSSTTKGVLRNISTTKLKAISNILDESLWATEELVDSITWAASYYHQPISRVLVTALPAALIKNKTASIRRPPVWIAKPTTSEEGTATKLNRSPRQQALFYWLKENPNSTRKHIVSAGFDPALLKKLGEHNLVEAIENSEHQYTATSKPLLRTSPPTLTSEQQKTTLEINSDRAARSEGFKPRLLEGVTGSGKTEIYLQAAKPVLDQAGQILVLVPEIGLITQLKKNFESRFSLPVITYSSNSTDSERLQCWQAVRNEHPRIVIGTRSSVFLPFENLQLLVIDEEHDLSYKQQDGFRYSSRDLAILRARALKAQVILGSATPSIESLRNVSLGNYRHSEMRKRVTGQALPAIHLLERSPNDHQVISNKSLDQIQEQLNNRSQVMVFINRRGYAPRFNCNNCGWLARCESCNMAFCMHIHPPRLICHHCDTWINIPTSCPSCQSTKLSELGAGTEQIERVLTQLFPNHLCIRVDRDSTSGKDGLQRKIAPAVAGEPCILVGTQMLAKGHHLPKLSLAIILNADQALFSHDYRAIEHLGQLVTQVAGRTGRTEQGLGDHGKLILETTFPDHPVLASLARLPYSEFVAELINERQERGLPPFSYAAIVRAECNDLNALIQFMEKAATQIHLTQSTFLQVLGPFPSAMEKRKGQFRYQIDLQSTDRKTLHACLNQLRTYLKELKGFSTLKWDFDIDPLTLD